MSDVMTFSPGMDDAEIDAVDDISIEISRVKESIGNLPSHRNYAVAITKLDEARLWLRDRQHQPPSPKRPD